MQTVERNATSMDSNVCAWTCQANPFDLPDFIYNMVMIGNDV